MKKVVLAALLFAFAFSAPAQAPPKNKFHKKLWNATFALYGYLPSEDVSHFICTATIFQKVGKKYELVTADHCVEGDVPEGLSFYISPEIVEDGGAEAVKNMQPVKVVAEKRDDKAGIDCAILEFTSDKKYPIIPLGDESELSVGQSVVNVHFSEGASKQLSLGAVSSQEMPNGGSQGDCQTCPHRYTVQSYGAPGASGSAIVSEKTHTIVGILEGGFSDGSSHIIPISRLKQIQ